MQHQSHWFILRHTKSWKWQKEEKRSVPGQRLFLSAICSLLAVYCEFTSLSTKNNITLLVFLFMKCKQTGYTMNGSFKLKTKNKQYYLCSVMSCGRLTLGNAKPLKMLWLNSLCLGDNQYLQLCASRGGKIFAWERFLPITLTVLIDRITP